MYKINPYHLISLAANIKTGEGNPEYTVDEFLTIYPQFKSVDPGIISFYIKIASSSLSYDLYGDVWEMAMGLFIAHYLTLWLKASNGIDEDTPIAKVLNQSLSLGLLASKSAGDLSLSYDFSSILSDLDGWGAWKLTLYGQQLVTLAKPLGRIGSYIW